MNTRIPFVIGALLVIGALAATTVKPALAYNGLVASSGAVNPGDAVTLTQTLDSPLVGTVTSFTVQEADGDVCAANTLGSVSSGSPMVRSYPSDFSLMSAGGNGVCDTTTPGMYDAIVTMDTSLGKRTFHATFETNFFVLPESPIGVAALMGSSLAVLGAFVGLRRYKASVSVPQL
jgi:hypothetical protein